MTQKSYIHERNNISADLADSLRAMIVDGSLQPGERINEARLAESLGVSRTPLREALMTLCAEGGAEAIPRRGFFVRELTVSEATDIYPIRALLDPEALRLAGIPDSAQLDKLDQLARKLESARTVRQAIELDDTWHLRLYANCPNGELITLIKQYMRRTRRYEFASMNNQRTLASSIQSKLTITTALRDNKLERACDTLSSSLRNGVTPVLEWLRREERHD